jgi:hypothetical protein
VKKECCTKETKKWRSDNNYEKADHGITVFCFILSAPFLPCAQERQEQQEPLKEPLRDKAAAFAHIEKASSTVHAVMSEFRQERRLAMLKERSFPRDVFITKNRISCAGNLSILILPVLSSTVKQQSNGKEKAIYLRRLISGRILSYGLLSIR